MQLFQYIVLFMKQMENIQSIYLSRDGQNYKKELFPFHNLNEVINDTK